MEVVAFTNMTLKSSHEFLNPADTVISHKADGWCNDLPLGMGTVISDCRAVLMIADPGTYLKILYEPGLSAWSQCLSDPVYPRVHVWPERRKSFRPESTTMLRPPSWSVYVGYTVQNHFLFF